MTDAVCSRWLLLFAALVLFGFAQWRRRDTAREAEGLVAMGALEMASEAPELHGLPARLHQQEQGGAPQAPLVTPSQASPSAPAPVLPAEFERVPVTAARLTLLVTSLRELAPGAERVPHVAFVLHRRGAGPAAAPIYAGQTDAGGECMVELPWQASGAGESDRPPALVGRVVELGYQQHFVRSAPPREGERFGRLELLAIPGSTQRGQVLNASGKGVEARVSFHGRRPEADSQSADLVVTATYLGSGHFELHLGQSMRGFLLAEAKGVGTACLRDVQIDLRSPPQNLRLVLRGSGLLRGALKNTKGQPVAGHTLLFRLATLDRIQEGTRLPEPLATELRIEALGCLWQRVVTDERGWFQCEGLRVDEYVLRTNQTPVGNGWSLLLTDEPVRADGARLELTLPELALHDPGQRPTQGK